MNLARYNSLLEGVRIMIVRRRYGRTTFSWVHWTTDPETTPNGSVQWHEIGTPWQSIWPPMAEVAEEILRDRATRVAPNLSQSGGAPRSAASNSAEALLVAASDVQAC